MGKLGSDRIINLKLYCTVNENVVLIFFFYLAISDRKMVRQKVDWNICTKQSCTVVVFWSVFMNIKQLSDDYISAYD